MIKDLVIMTFPETSILIENSNAYLIIKNSTIGHASYPNAGIKLVNVNNSQIINNDCSLNYYGIYFEIDFYQEAGEKAEKRKDYLNAIQHFQQAITLLSDASIFKENESESRIKKLEKKVFNLQKLV